MIAIRDRVRFVETDMMGVVHHANYLRWFEMGRVAYLRLACAIIVPLPIRTASVNVPPTSIPSSISSPRFSAHSLTFYNSISILKKPAKKKNYSKKKNRLTAVLIEFLYYASKACSSSLCKVIIFLTV